MSWGHAVSDDLFHWRHLPIALHDEHNVMAFSGSAVVDRRNTSGFGIGQLPPLVAIYTGHSAGLQTQDLAFSNDRGRTWTKYENNPVLDIGKADFRDPKVFWYAPQQCWIMVVSLATELKVQFYVSTNLRDWTLLSEFGPAGVANKPNWECPDLFELPIENENGAKRWVLEVDIGSGSIAGGSGGEYFTGVFDGKQFLADSKDSQWVDYGRDFYAPVSYADIPESDGRRIWIGWMNNWETSLNPTSPWRGAMSIPRQLTLRRINGLLKLCQRPVHEVNSLRTSTERLKPKQLNNSDGLLSTAGNQVELTLAFKPGTASEFGVRVLKGAGCQTEIGYDMKTNAMFVDRTKSGNVDFHPAFAGRHSGPMTVDESGLVRMRIFVDTCSVEAFGNYGETVITDLVFPDPRAIGIELFARGGSCQLVEGSVHSIGTTMRKP